MKLNLKSMLLGCVVGAAVVSTIPAMGYDGTRTIQAVFKNIKICVDGVAMTPRDSAGKEVEPFIYNGTTYLPVRAVGEAVGKEVTYDGSTSTVYLGKSGQVKYLGQQVKAYQTSKAREGTYSMGGKKYTNSLQMYNGGGDAFYNLDGLYTSVTGLYGMSDDTESGTEGTIYIYGDGKLLSSFDVKAGELPKNFNLNVTGVAQLNIQADLNRIDARACLGSVEFK